MRGNTVRRAGRGSLHRPNLVLNSRSSFRSRCSVTDAAKHFAGDVFYVLRYGNGVVLRRQLLGAVPRQVAIGCIVFGLIRSIDQCFEGNVMIRQQQSLWR